MAFLLDPVFFILELIGTVAFAISGALVAIEKKMDILGVAVLGMTTAVGGGILRDIILGITPPTAFRDPIYAFVSIACSLIMFLPSVRKALNRIPRIYDLTVRCIDALGLGLFTVIGIRVAFFAHIGSKVFLCVFVGVVTGVGGGVMRDLFAGNKPYIFVKHFYACASIIGALACVWLWPFIGQTAAMALGAVIVIALRLIAAYRRWELPRAE